MHRRIPALVLLATLGTACEDGGSPGTGDTETDTQDDCPSGMHKATSASATVSSLVVGGITVLTSLDANATYDTYGDAACVDDAGERGRVILADASGPFLILTFGATETGSIDFGSSSTDLLVEVVGATDPFDITTGSGEWTTVFGSFDSITNPLQVTVNGSAINQDGLSQTLEISVSAAVTP